MNNYRQFLTSTNLLIAVNVALAGFVVFSVYPISSWPVFNKGISPKELQANVDRIYKDCLRSPKGVELCYEGDLAALAAKTSIDFSRSVLYASQDLEPNLRNCHELAHAISRGAVRAHPDQWKTYLEHADANECGGGFFHGILEAHFGDEKSFQVTPSLVEEICIDPNKPLEYRNRTCAHIFGHISVLEGKGDMKPGLAMCGGLNEPSLRLECYTGVFMEDSFKTMLVDHGYAKEPVRDLARLQKQEKRCFNYDGAAGMGCWTDMAEIFAEYYHYDPVMTYKSCNQAPDSIERNYCYMKGVILIGAAPNNDDANQILSTCQFYTPNTNGQYEQCIHFLISSFEYYSPKFTSRGVTLCSNVADNFQAKCFADLGQQLKGIVPSLAERTGLCQGAQGEDMKLCAGS